MTEDHVMRLLEFCEGEAHMGDSRAQKLLKEIRAANKKAAKNAPTPRIAGVKGQLFFRRGGNAPGSKNRELIVVVGVLASPEGVPFPVKDEHQYVAVGTLPGELFVMPGTEIDRSDRVHGYRADQILTMPIWRV